MGIRRRALTAWTSAAAGVLARAGLGVAATVSVTLAVSLAVTLAMTLALAPAAAVAAAPTDEAPLPPPPAPRPAQRPKPPSDQKATATPPRQSVDSAAARAERARLIGRARNWGYQLNGLAIETAARAPYDLLVVDATTGLAANRPFLPAEVEALKRKPDGSRRVVVSYLSIGEAEDYRPDYFTSEYMTEDAPDWLMHENPQWKGNRIIRFCREGWQQTILGDEDGKSVYNSIESSPLYRLLDLGFDGVYLDRVDVYSEVQRECPDAEKRMVEFVARLARHARKKNPSFIVILQNAEELVRHKAMVDAIDAIAKEDLFYGVDYSEKANNAAMVKAVIENLDIAKAAGRPVFVVDYVKDPAKIRDAKRRIEQQGYIPYIGPRDLGTLWLPGVNF